MENKKYYIAHGVYIGSNEDTDRYIDAEELLICESDDDIDLNTYQFNDVVIYYYGMFDTVADAKKFITEKFYSVRNADDEDAHFLEKDGNEVERYKVGKYIPLCTEDAENWLYEDIKNDIHADTTDERIDELVAEYEESANKEGYTLNNIQDILIKRREELQDELDILS